MKKRLWKQVTAFVMACVLITGLVEVNTTLAAGNEEKAAVMSQQKKVNGKAAKEKINTKNLWERVEQNTSELNKILEECEAVESDNLSKKIRKGQMTSVSEGFYSGATYMAIMSNGDLYCWGLNHHGQVGNGTTENQLTPVKVLSNVRYVSFSSSHSIFFAITTNGDLYCWGYDKTLSNRSPNEEYQTTPVKMLSDVKYVSSSDAYSSSNYYLMSAIKTNGDLYCWGYNNYGQVGNGTKENQTEPIRVLNDVKYVYSNYTMSAITNNGDLYCWGYNEHGQVGNGTKENQTIPVKVLGDVESVSYSPVNTYSDSKGSHSIYFVSAIKTNGDLYCWGCNRYDRGNGETREDQTTPAKILSNVASISYSTSDCCSVSAITENGDLYCWGYNRHGEVGNGTTEEQETPVKVLDNVNSVSYLRGGDRCSVSAITENGDLYCWGYNEYGQVGNGTTKNQTIPVKVLSNVKSVSHFGNCQYNYYSVSAITKNGDLYCWGYNNHGQIGNGTIGEKQTTPVNVLSNVKSIFYSSYFEYQGPLHCSVSAITENGDLYCWGENQTGQVGNGTTTNQSIPVKVLSDVKSIFYFPFYNISSACSVSAITKNGDLYCWGANHYGQVGNGTIEKQTTPAKILSDVINAFYYDAFYNYGGCSVSAITENGDLYSWGYNEGGEIGSGTTENQLTPTLILGPSLTPGLSKDGCLQIPDSMTVEKGKSRYIAGKIFVDNLDLNQQKEINQSLELSSANPSVATVERNPFDLIMNDDGRYTNSDYMQLSIKVTGVSRGETDILVSASDGSKVCCHVVVSKPVETEEEPDETGYSYCFGIAGELQDVNSANHTMKINGVSYEASSDSIISVAKEILEQHDNKIVVCQVRAADNQIVRVDDIRDIIGEPSVHIKPEVDNINYENGKISKKSFKIDLEMYCAIKEPYSLSDISDVIKKIDGLEVSFSKVSLETWYNDTGEIPFLLKDGLFGNQTTTLEKELDFKLKPGQMKKISVTAYVKDNLLIENVNANAVIKAKVNDDKKTETTETIHLSNLDKSREEEQKKLAASPKSAELQKANTILDGSHMAYDEGALKECLTDTEVKAISSQVNNWIYTFNALNSIINDDSDSSVLKKLLKKYGLTKEGLADKVCKKLGIDKKVIPGAYHPYKGTLLFEAKHKKTGKNITIKFTADMQFYGFGGSDSAYGGFGTLNYKISSGGSGKGPITFVNFDSFVTSLKKVVDSQMHNCFNKIYADGINEIFNESVADSLVSSTFAKVVNQKYGSASEAVYTGLKSAFTGYTEEDAKKDIKDVVIILAKDTINRYTHQSIDCPVNVTVYDGDGNICAEIKDDVVNEKYQDVAAYVKGEAKYLLLPDADYILCYSGNDTGTMDYKVTEYENGEVVRELIYNDVPLTTEKEYVNYLISGRHQGISLYNLNQVDGGVVEATSDIDKTKEQNISAKSITLSDTALSMEKGQSYILMETVSPDDAIGYDLTWSSSNEEVVEVSSSGVLYAKADGEAVITVTIDGRNLSDSCKVTVGKESVSPVPDSTNTPAVTENPGSPTPQPTARPTDTIKPSCTNAPVPTATSTGTISPIYTNTPVPTANPTSTTRPADIQTPVPTDEPTETPNATLKPSDNPSPTTAPTSENNSNSEKKLKKGSKVTDKKTKAVYTITGTGNNRTVEYVKCTKKNPASISVPASVKLKGKVYKVTSVGKAAFKNSKELKTVKLGKNVKKIGKQAFSGCTKLTNVALGRNVTTIEANAFSKCTTLTIITIPSKVTKIGAKAFYQCKNLQYILVKTNKLTAKNVGSNAFGKGSTKLRVKTDKNKWRLYAQIFMAKGMSKKALFIIDPVKLVI